jgi:putative phage-type endonuclease
MRGKIIEGVQGSPEWIAARDRCITSSDAAVLTGNCPYRTPLQLYEHKLGIKRFDDTGKEWLFQRGHEVEAWAREVYERETGLKMLPRIVIPNDRHYTLVCPLMTSLDGGTDDLSRVLEIKYVGEKVFSIISGGTIPPHHLDQVQFHLFVSGADSCDYMAARAVGGQSVIINVKPDQPHIDTILFRARAFYERIKDKRPPEAIDRDFKLAREPGLKSFIADLSRIVMLPDRVRSGGVRIQRLTSDAPSKYTRYIVEVCNAATDRPESV